MSLFVTSFLDSLAADAWIRRPPESARIAGSMHSWAMAQPGFASALTPIAQKSQLAALRNVDSRQTAARPGPGVGTDRLRHRDRARSHARRHRERGRRVRAADAPSRSPPASSTMTVEPDGRRTPDPGATARRVSADDDRVRDGARRDPRRRRVQRLARVAASALVVAGVPHGAGPGGRSAAGFVPLTPDLAADAEQAIAQGGRVAVDRGVHPHRPGRTRVRGGGGRTGREPDRRDRHRRLWLGLRLGRHWQRQRLRARCGRSQPVNAHRAGGCGRARRCRRADTATIPRHRRGERDHLADSPAARRRPHIGRRVPDLRPAGAASPGVRQRAACERARAASCADYPSHDGVDAETIPSSGRHRT